jgi:hypothetical protein
MAFMVSGSENKTYAPAPEGAHLAVCVDIIDQGMKPNPFRDGALQRKVDIAWQIEEVRDDGKRFVVYKRYTASLNEKATLRHDLESWRGKPFTAAELVGFDLESVIGANCILNIVHKAGKEQGKVFANVAAVMPLMKGIAKIAPVGYERKSAQEETAPPPNDEDFGPSSAMEEEPPF